LDYSGSAAQLYPTEQGERNTVYLNHDQLIKMQERKSNRDRYSEVIDMAIENCRSMVVVFLGEIERADLKR